MMNESLRNILFISWLGVWTVCIIVAGLAVALAAERLRRDRRVLVRDRGLFERENRYSRERL